MELVLWLVMLLSIGHTLGCHPGKHSRHDQGDTVQSQGIQQNETFNQHGQNVDSTEDMTNFSGFIGMDEIGRNDKRHEHMQDPGGFGPSDGHNHTGFDPKEKDGSGAVYNREGSADLNSFIEIGGSKGGQKKPKLSQRAFGTQSGQDQGDYESRSKQRISDNLPIQENRRFESRNGILRGGSFGPLDRKSDIDIGNNFIQENSQGRGIKTENNHSHGKLKFGSENENGQNLAEHKKLNSKGLSITPSSYIGYDIPNSFIEIDESQNVSESRYGQGRNNVGSQFGQGFGRSSSQYVQGHIRSRSKNGKGQSEFGSRGKHESENFEHQGLAGSEGFASQEGSQKHEGFGR